MKFFSRFLYIFLSIIIFLFCSCSGLFSAFDSEEAKENTGFIRVKNSERTILPNTDTSDLTDFVLTGEKEGSTKVLANVDSFEELSAETIELECGTWTFTLSAKSKSTNATFSASLEKSIETASTTELSFILETEYTTGSLCIEISIVDNWNKAELSLKTGGGYRTVNG